MSKRELKAYLKSLKKEHLEEQVIDLYERFKDVKVYYDFVFNPNEQKLVDECKIKISNEYFPVKRKKAKARRSVAQKFIKHFMTLGMEPSLIADVMLYNIEIAVTFGMQKYRLADAFYKSIYKSFEQAVEYLVDQNLMLEFKPRLIKIVKEVNTETWQNKEDFNRIMISRF